MTVLGVLLYIYIFYGLYLIYCTLRRARNNGKLAATPIYVRWISWSYIYVGVAMDFAFNVTFGALLFLETPWGHGALFTARCKEHRADNGWRGRVAMWVCESWLNPHEDHC